MCVQSRGRDRQDLFWTGPEQVLPATLGEQKLVADPKAAIDYFIITSGGSNQT